MSIAAAPAKSAPSLGPWRTPAILVAVGCAIALIAFGPRSALGQFLSPLSLERGWSRYRGSRCTVCDVPWEGW